MSKTVIIVIAAVVVLFMGMMGAGFFIIWTKVSAAIPAQQTTEEAEQAEEELATLGPMYPLETLIVNLADEGGKRYLRTTMQLELDNPELVQEIENKLPQVKDSILMILPTKRYRDVSNTQGKTALRDELIATLNGFFTKGAITNIYFTEFVIQ